MSCCTSSKHLSSMKKECRYWKERYFVEKKCRTSLANWIIGVFGFVVKVECDKITNIIKIEGRESKEAMKHAAAPSPAAEDKVLLMEDKINAEDFIEEQEELDGLAIAMEMHSPDDESSSSSSESKLQIVRTSSVTSGSSVSHLQHATSMDVSCPEDNSSSAEVVYIGNYEDSNLAAGGQSSYFILKSGDNEDIPVQFDYTTFINGDIESSSDNQQVFYRIASPQESINEAEPASTSNTTVSYKSAVSTPKKKAISVKYPKTKKTTLQNIPTKFPKNTEFDNTVVSVVSQKKTPAPKTKKEMSNSTKPDEKIITNKSPLEFGLTLREKAEIYVRTKAKAAIRKSGSGYTCTLCPNDYSYSTIDNAITHTKSHFESKPYKCEYCEETFSIQRQLLQHRKLSHPKLKGSNQSQQEFKSSPVKQVKPTMSPLTYITPIAIMPSNKPTTPMKSNTGKPIVLQSKDNSNLNNTKKPFKCQVAGCTWSYISAEELGWHMKAHSQARV